MCEIGALSINRKKNEKKKREKNARLSRLVEGQRTGLVAAVNL